ncbi:MAG: DoxX family protein [Candidatus Dormiibacterota bacterium]
MNIALWVLQVLLGFFFVFHAFVMLRPSPGGMKYILEMPAGLRRFAGIAEGLAGLALVIPPLVRVLTWLTPLAAVGLVLLMLGAIVFHIRRSEYPNVGFNAVLGVLAAVIAWGRFGPYPF